MLAKYLKKIPLLLIVLFGLVTHLNVYANTKATLVGSTKCQQCHQKTYNKWQQSHHWHAMEVASDKSVLGDFNNAEFDYFGIKSHFFKKNDRFYVSTDNQAGELEDFEISYTFGYFPLQQYLIKFPDGRLQALSIAWDSRPKAEGGQRWYHLYPDERIDYRDGLHWTGAFHNWNSRCASCHSTRLDKNYSMQSDSYDTDWFEINVGCESCHGAGGGHVEWVRGGGSPALKNKGWSHAITDRGKWSPSEKRPTFKRSEGSPANQQIEVCASCHARRSELAVREHGKAFLDGHSLRLLEQDMYHADGQIQDEVYVYGSFLQSKMYREGVSCSNCHDPHSLKIKAEGNALCLQCHSAKSYDMKKHHHHVAGSEGAQCVSCHMPETTYMGVDKRRDHSFKIPDPSLTLQLGIPNACNRCHDKQGAKWSLSQLEDWFGKNKAVDQHALTLEKARRSDASVFPSLIALANDVSQSEVLRATAALEAGRFFDQQTLAQIEPSLKSDKALLRLAAVRSLDAVPVQTRYALLQALVKDKVKAVRMAVAVQLTALPLEQLPESQAGELRVLFEEYLDSEMFNADMPSAQMNMALFYIGRGDALAAESAYLHALKLSPQYLPALLNLADLYRMLQRDSEGRVILERAINTAPQSAAAHHALGLLYARQKELSKAVNFLEQASLLVPANTRYVYVYAIALQNTDQLPLAIGVLEYYLNKQVRNEQLVSLLASYYQQAGEVEKFNALQSE